MQIDERSLKFIPYQPYQLDTVYTISIGSDIITKDGHAIKKEHKWKFMVREPMVAFLSPNARDSSIWALDLKGNPPQRLTREGNSVIAFDVAPSGDFLIYMVIDFSNAGMDLWKVSRKGNDDELLLDCGFDRCSRVAISPNSQYIAYTRDSSGKRKDRPFGSPRIWLLNLQTGENSPVYEDEEILGFNIYWSPDSNRIASFDGLSNKIRIIDLAQKKQYTFSSNTSDPIAWAPDSNRILFTNLVQTNNRVVTHVLIGDVSLEKEQTLIGENDGEDHSYNSLAWSLREDQAVLSLRRKEDSLEQVLRLFNPSTQEGFIIASQPDYTYTLPQWNPWGNLLIFQQAKLQGTYNPEIVLWQLGFSEPLILTKGLMPHWLP